MQSGCISGRKEIRNFRLPQSRALCPNRSIQHSTQRVCSDSRAGISDQGSALVGYVPK